MILALSPFLKLQMWSWMNRQENKWTASSHSILAIETCSCISFFRVFC